MVPLEECFRKTKPYPLVQIIHGNNRLCPTPAAGGANFNFKGNRWETVRKEENRRYLLNAYRVLLTRARQGMVIFVPPGSSSDATRKREYYDATYAYLRDMGVQGLS